MRGTVDRRRGRSDRRGHRRRLAGRRRGPLRQPGSAAGARKPPRPVHDRWAGRVLVQKRSALQLSRCRPTVPAGELLKALGRHPMRPAHIHLRVTAPGFRSVTTHVFVAGDPYLGSDAAFAVKDGADRRAGAHHRPVAAAAHEVDVPFRLFEFSDQTCRPSRWSHGGSR